MSIEHRRVQTNGVELHVASIGPADGPLVILLHGFPELWFGWRNQYQVLADAGYHVIIPDQRGYNTSDKPPHVADYSIDVLAADVVGLIDAHGRQSAALVGHDWGGAVAWWTALRYPERIDKVSVLNCPHPVLMKRRLAQSPRQLWKSLYMVFFQLPWLPEHQFHRAGGVPLSRGIAKTALPGSFTPEDLEVYQRAWQEPGAARGMINWYRAGLRAPPQIPESIRIRVPMLLIWGLGDEFLGQEMAQTSIETCDQGRLERIEEATHWVQHDAPERVNQLILEHLQS